MRSPIPWIPARAAAVAIVAAALFTAGALTGTGAAEAPLLVWDATLYGSVEIPVRWPVGVASGASGEIVVADAFSKTVVIFRETKDGWAPERAVPMEGTPTGIVTGGPGYLVAMRGPAGLAWIQRENWAVRKGAFPRGAIPGPMASLPGGSALVMDMATSSVLTVTAETGAISTTPVGGGGQALAAAPGGGFWLARVEGALVERRGPSGDVLDSWRLAGEPPRPAWPAGLVMEPGGGLLVLDRRAARVLLLDVSGRLEAVGSRAGHDEGRLSSPSGIALLPDGRVAVADTGNERVQVFRRVDAGGGS